MSLTNDGNYRGSHACHVGPHPKLGVHRTVIHAAFDLVCTLLEREDVAMVEFGKLVHSGANGFRHRCAVESAGKTLRLLLVTTAVAQQLTIKLTNPAPVPDIASFVEAQWEAEFLVSERERKKEFA